MDTQHNSIPDSAFNVKGLKALSRVCGNIMPDTFPGKNIDTDALGGYVCGLSDSAMDLPAANLEDLEWKLRNFASELEAFRYEVLIAEPGASDWKRWADLLRADILRLIGTGAQP